VAKRASSTRFGPVRLWPAKNRLGQVRPPPINGLDIVTHLILERAGGLAGQQAGPPLFF